jgi:hypothetical protein
VDKGGDEQLNKALAMNGNESTGKRMKAPPSIWIIAPDDPNYIKFYSRTHVKNVKGGAPPANSNPRRSSLGSGPDKRFAGPGTPPLAGVGAGAGVVSCVSHPTRVPVRLPVPQRAEASSTRLKVLIYLASIVAAGPSTRRSPTSWRIYKSTVKAVWRGQGVGQRSLRQRRR